MSLKKILAPVDGSQSSRDAEQVTAQIAKKTGATVTVMHVIPYSLLYAKLRSGYQIRPAIRDQIMGGIEENAEKLIDDAQAFFAKEGIMVDSNRANFADVAYSILKTSEQGYSLVVMGSRGENEKDPYDLGSVTKKVVRYGSVPTLIVKKVSPLSSMLVCLDGSKHSVGALKFAVQLAEKMDSKITLINVEERQLRNLLPKVAEEFADKILSAAQGTVRKKELKIDKRVECGVPQDVIVEVAEKGSHDLIVLSSVGLGTVKRFLLGSVSEDVIHKAKCSVLVVPPPRRST